MEPVEATTLYLLRNTSTQYYGAYNRDGYQILVLSGTAFCKDYEDTGIKGGATEMRAFRDYLQQHYPKQKVENIEFIWEMRKMS